MMKETEVLRFWNLGYAIHEIAVFMKITNEEVVKILDGWPSDVKRSA